MDRLIDALDIGIPCVFHLLTGLYCPGCGGTRAVRSLLKGDLLMSFQYHPLVLYAIAVFFLEVILRCGSKYFHRPMDHRKIDGIFVLTGAAIVVINWIFKNYMLVFQRADLLPILK